MTALLITAAATTTAATFLADAAAGTVQFHKERAGNGTTRRVHFLADGTEARELADFIQVRREDGASMKAVASELHMSVAAVRRSLNDLLMTLELEAMDAEELADLLDGAAELAEEPTTEQAEAPYVCTWEGHADAMQEAGMCPVCQ